MQFDEALVIPGFEGHFLRVVYTSFRVAGVEFQKGGLSPWPPRDVVKLVVVQAGDFHCNALAGRI